MSNSTPLLPPSFTTQMQQLLGDSYQDFLVALQQPPPTSIRINPAKPVAAPDKSAPIRWNPNGYYLDERPKFTLDPHFHAGAYYVQEASSMFITSAIQHAVDLSQDYKVLDLCAAPGGKTTLLASLFSRDSFILANEVIKSRYQILRQNLIKWGYSNVHTSNHDGQDFKSLAGFFDVVLVDAPCSGEGLFRKDPKAIREWSPEHVQHCAQRQKRILAAAQQTLAPGGILIYCTCTYNDLENEDNAKWLQQEFQLEPLSITIPESWGVTKKEIGYQFYPHRAKGEGFYLAFFSNQGSSKELPPKKGKLQLGDWKKISRKQQAAYSSWIPQSEALTLLAHENQKIRMVKSAHLEHLNLIFQRLRRWHMGIAFGTMKGKDLIPAHDLALSADYHHNQSMVSVAKNQALRFLKKETVVLDDLDTGWHLLRYEAHALGWIKKVQKRINNYFPKEWRIRMDIE